MYPITSPALRCSNGRTPDVSEKKIKPRTINIPPMTNFELDFILYIYLI